MSSRAESLSENISELLRSLDEARSEDEENGWTKGARIGASRTDVSARKVVDLVMPNGQPFRD